MDADDDITDSDVTHDDAISELNPLTVNDIVTKTLRKARNFIAKKMVQCFYSYLQIEWDTGRSIQTATVGQLMIGLPILEIPEASARLIVESLVQFNTVNTCEL